MRTTIIAAAALLAVAVGGGVVAKVAGGAAEVREVRLVVRGMTFYSENMNDANPTLHFKRGEKVRFVLTNEDLGYTHNLISPALSLSTPLLKQGESRAVEITVPDLPGVSTYSCTPHSEMMKGTITIE